MHQIEMVSLNDLIPAQHNYHQFIRFWSFESISKQFKKNNPYKGYGFLYLFKYLLLQFMENLSDQKLENYLPENNAAKSFGEFGEVLAMDGRLSRIRPKMKA